MNLNLQARPDQTRPHQTRRVMRACLAKLGNPGPDCASLGERLAPVDNTGNGFTGLRQTNFLRASLRPSPWANGTATRRTLERRQSSKLHLMPDKSDPRHDTCIHYRNGLSLNTAHSTVSRLNQSTPGWHMGALKSFKPAPRRAAPSWLCAPTSISVRPRTTSPTRFSKRKKKKIGRGKKKIKNQKSSSSNPSPDLFFPWTPATRDEQWRHETHSVPSSLARSAWFLDGVHFPPADVPLESHKSIADAGVRGWAKLSPGLASNQSKAADQLDRAGPVCRRGQHEAFQTPVDEAGMPSGAFLFSLSLRDAAAAAAASSSTAFSPSPPQLLPSCCLPALITVLFGQCPMPQCPQFSVAQH